MLRVLSFTFTILVAATNAGAQELPALYDVTGVASDDILNVRAEPNGSAPIIGTLAHDATGVEVVAVSDTGTWGLVNSAEQAGWASLAFLEPQEFGGFPGRPAFSCFGTEPFWSVVVNPGELSFYSNADGTEADMLAADVMPALNTLGAYGMRLASPLDEAVLTIRRESCGDGMSDREYGLSAIMVLGGRLQGTLSGCCSLEAD